MRRLARSRRLLSTSAPRAPEVVEYEAGIIVEPDVSSIYQALVKMLEDENKLSIFSKNAKKLVNEKYLLKDQVKKYENMYLNAIKNNPQI